MRRKNLETVKGVINVSDFYINLNDLHINVNDFYINVIDIQKLFS